MTVSNYAKEIENINQKLYQKVQIALEYRKKTSNYSHKNLKSIYEEIANYYFCGNNMKETAIKYSSSTHSIYYLFYNYIKSNDIELYEMIKDMIEINNQKSINARTNIRKMKSVEERLKMCRIILDKRLRLKYAKVRFNLDVKTIKNYIKTIEDIDNELFNDVCEFLKIKL